MVYTFACSVGCFINDNWEIIEHVIDFKPLEDKEHEGLHGGKAFVDGACKIGSLDKISRTYDSVHCSGYLPPSHCISISTNNVSVNVTVVMLFWLCDERSSSRVNTLLTNPFPRHVTVTA